jgi:hypothetical protein
MMVPTVRQWQRDCNESGTDQATPKCPLCGRCLGVREAMYNPSGTDEWLCDNACCDGNEWEATDNDGPRSPR